MSQPIINFGNGWRLVILYHHTWSAKNDLKKNHYSFFCFVFLFSFFFVVSTVPADSLASWNSGTYAIQWSQRGPVPGLTGNLAKTGCSCVGAHFCQTASFNSMSPSDHNAIMPQFMIYLGHKWFKWWLVAWGPLTFNLLRPSGGYMRHWPESSLVWVMAWRLFGTKPLPEPMLTYCQVDPWTNAILSQPQCVKWTDVD